MVADPAHGAREGRAAFETDAERYFADRQVRVGEQPAGILVTLALLELADREAGAFAEQTRNVTAGDAEALFQRVERNVLIGMAGHEGFEFGDQRHAVLAGRSPRHRLAGDDLANALHQQGRRQGLADRRAAIGAHVVAQRDFLQRTNRGGSAHEDGTRVRRRNSPSEPIPVSSFCNASSVT
jgi:hypothetical protein